MNEEVSSQLKKIKQSFRLKMNGEVSRSMREKGVEYKLNWGVSIPDLKMMSKEYGKNYDLAIELWKENIRECKILATMIMPAEKMLPEIVDIWMEQTPTQEIAEMAVFNLYQNLEYAPVLAYQWIASSKQMVQMSGFLLLARLFMKGQEPNERGIHEFIDQAIASLEGNDINVRHAASVCLTRFADLGDEYKKIVKNALKSSNFELF